VTAVLVIPAVGVPGAPPHKLLAEAKRGLVEAAGTPAERYAAIHLAALRAAAAVLGARSAPDFITRKPVASVWVYLTLCAPELGEWAAFFAAGAAKRSATEAGVAAVTGEEADELAEQVRRWLEVVEEVTR
jgi:hypothetical protein